MGIQGAGECHVGFSFSCLDYIGENVKPDDSELRAQRIDSVEVREGEW